MTRDGEEQRTLRSTDGKFTETPSIKQLSPSMTAATYPLRVKLLALLALVSTQIASSSILKLSSFLYGSYKYSPQSSLTLSELIKLFLSLAFHFHVSSKSTSTFRRTLFDQSTRPILLHMYGLALLYCFNNGLMFWLFERADPGSIVLVKSGGTIVSALIMYVTRRFRLSIGRWIVVILQTFGVIIAQFNACSGTAHLLPMVYAALVLSLANSSIANVWNEHVIKQYPGCSIAVKNVHLYLAGSVFNAATYHYLRLTKPTSTPDFLEGYGGLAVGVVLCNALIGVSMNVVYKYADAVMKNLATSTTTVVLVMLSAAFWGGKADITTGLGSGVVVGGLVLYFWVGVMEGKLKALQERLKL